MHQVIITVRLLLVLSVFISLFLISASSAQEQPASGPKPEFLKIEGTRFAGDFKFIGANLAPWRFMPAYGESYTREEINAWVHDAVSLSGARVIRMHINGNGLQKRQKHHGLGAHQ
jgi:hypothetical protein